MFRSLSFRAIALAAVVGSALLILLGALYISTQQTHSELIRVDRTQTTIETIEVATGRLRAAESGQRGFILTHDPAFAGAFEDSIGKATAASARLVELSKDNPGQRERADRLMHLIAGRADYLTTNFDRARAGQFDAAARDIAAGQGRRLMRDVDQLADEFLAEERRQMRLRAQRMEGLVDSSRLLLFIGGPLIVLMVMGFAYSAMEQVRRPARTILAAMERLAAASAADDPPTVPRNHGSTEFDQLAAGYNAMALRLAEAAKLRHQAEDSLHTSNAALAESASAAESRGAAIERLAGMAHRMQAARSDDEMALVIACFVPQVLPNSSGALYAFNNSRNHLGLVAQWGGGEPASASFAPDECWALRRGQSHAVIAPDADIVCGHIDDGAIPYHCEPLLAGGDVIGLLQLDGEVVQRDLFMLNALAENIASALVNQRLQRGLREQTIRDPLTGLYNRRYMEEALSTEIARCARSGTPLALVMCDVDHFKRFNDEFGHSAGDAVLQAVGAEMNRQFRDGDVVCRFGGEEFAIIAPGATPEALAGRIEQLRLAISRLMVRDGMRTLGSISMSFGLAAWSDDLGSDGTVLINNADAALYKAKDQGRNRIVLAA
ncbi:MAG: diguanylate cyclase [Proteobacteria bacterium]|nr:diguanylate cyclase [Pseudomonadota bacterium]